MLAKEFIANFADANGDAKYLNILVNLPHFHSRFSTVIVNLFGDLVLNPKLGLPTVIDLFCDFVSLDVLFFRF